MEKATRTLIEGATQDARRTLEREFGRQLEGEYDILPSGQIPEEPGMHLDERGRLRRAKLVEAVGYQRAAGLSAHEAVAATIREAAFTTLNRFVALKMMEARGMVQECISKGENSAGFREFGGLAPGLATTADKGYRLYLEALFDEIGREVRVLFDRRDVAGILWPRRQVLSELLDLLNDPDLAEVWGADETIGWVYQYFNGEDERRKMRNESQAPRNSRELAVRNQFFTPRYVVEFLTDNTLGRTWYEMRRGETCLRDECHYLVLRKRPTFCGPGEDGPRPYRPDDTWAMPYPGEMWTRPNPDLVAASDLGGIWQYALTVQGESYADQHLHTDCRALTNAHTEVHRQTGKWEGTFEELRCCLYFTQRGWRHDSGTPTGTNLNALLSLYRAICERWDLETEYIEFRAKKDPRDMKILDPACGSGHFLLYCFDLLLTIYEEAWADEGGPVSEATGATLRADYPTVETLRVALPGLILRHNLHGIDIDPRAAQIAELALWMRAQRAYNDFGLPRGTRQAIRKTNVVVAEPMPGDAAMLRQFLLGVDERLRPLAQTIWEQMKLAGEAGSLLRIEREIADEITRARRQRTGDTAPLRLSTARGSNATVQNALPATGDAEGIFWDQAEETLLAALHDFAAQATSGGAMSRRLFEENATHGFAFVDLCRKKFDVVLMNPPFGAGSVSARGYIERTYPRTKNDIFSAFVERGLGLLCQRGIHGAITSRAGFFLTSFQRWREELLLGEARPTVIADLGNGVMDSAMVEAAAYCLEVVR